MKKHITYLKAAGKLTGYSTMASAFIAAGSNANAQVVYNDIDDETIESGDLFMIDIDGNGIDDFIFHLDENTALGWSFARVIGVSTYYVIGGPSNAVAGYTGSVVSHASAFNSGDPIGPGLDFLYNSTYFGAPLNQGFLASIYLGTSNGQFANVTDKYLGIQFAIDGNIHYGWMRLDVTVDPVEITIKDVAYDATAETAIQAGAGLVPVQNFLSDDDLTVYSFGSAINIIVKDLDADKGTVEVYNSSGQIVYSNALDMNGMNISLNNTASGNYTVCIFANDAVYSKQLFISK